MCKKKTKLYDMIPPPKHSEQNTKSLMERDPNDFMCYDWYNLSSAVVDRKGMITMRCAGVRRTGIDTFRHSVGTFSITPDHPDYAKFQKAIEEAKKPGA